MKQEQIDELVKRGQKLSYRMGLWFCFCSGVFAGLIIYAVLGPACSG